MTTLPPLPQDRISDFYWRYGLFNVWIGRSLWQLRAPWLEPLFSERSGAIKTVARAFGWRLTVRRHSAPGMTPTNRREG